MPAMIRIRRRGPVLYQPDDPTKAEILVFDTDWFLCKRVAAMFIVPRAVLLAGSNARRHRTPEIYQLKTAGFRGA